MLLRMNAPILGRRNGDLIEVSDDEGAKIIANYGDRVTKVADRPSTLRLVPSTDARVSRSQTARSVSEAQAEAVEQPADDTFAPSPIVGVANDPTVDEVLESMNMKMSDGDRD